MIINAFASASAAYAQKEQLMVMGDVGLAETVVYVTLSGAGAFLIAGLILVLFPISIAKKIVPYSVSDSPTIEIGDSDFSESVLVIVGLYILT